MKKYTIGDFKRDFPNDDVCLEYLRNKFYPKRIDCPICNKPTLYHRIRSKKVYCCDYCGHQISPTAGTIFDHSSTSLHDWFLAIFLMSTTRCGISAKQIQRFTGVTYKTAWRMFKQIRSLLDDEVPMLSGKVEADETYIGGKRHGKRGRGAEGKTPVVGIVERQGKIQAKVTGDLKSCSVKPFILDHVAQNSMMYTDQYNVYADLDDFGFEHEWVNHDAEEWARGDVHTNTIEGFWSLMKRGINGVYHCVSPKYLQSYVNEYSFRYNHRKDEKSMFLTILEKV